MATLVHATRPFNHRQDLKGERINLTCWYCGQSNLVFSAEFYHGCIVDSHFIQCVNCGVSGPSERTEEDAIAAFSAIKIVKEPLK